MQASSGNFLQIRGARTHNLRAIDLNIPRDKIVIFTGVSGSGKSSLVMDTLFAEGQRRFLESLAPFARSFIDQLPRADVDELIGLPPTLSVSQSRSGQRSHPRSIVATVTEIHDYLRLIYARAGDVHCMGCGAILGSQSTDQIIRTVTQLPEGERLLILAPLVHGKKGDHREALAKIRREGFVRARIDGEVVGIDPLPEIDPARTHDIDMVVDRQIVRKEASERLGESIMTALRFGQGSMVLARHEGDRWRDHVFNTRLSCLACGTSRRDLEPRQFSFNSPFGACTDCEGLGIVQEISWAKVIPDERKSLTSGALHPWEGVAQVSLEKLLKEIAQAPALARVLGEPVSEWTAEQRTSLWEGSGNWGGLKSRLAAGLSDSATRSKVEPYLVNVRCSGCGGSRLLPESRAVTLGGLAIHELLALTIDEARPFWESLDLRSNRMELVSSAIEEIRQRLGFLSEVGVGYIALERSVETLSGGESQRIRLARSLGSGLTGVCYVLDEPTAGLHARDTGRLIGVLERLRDQRTSVLLVEHDEQAILRGDHIVEIGPGAGRHGGEVVAQGDRTSFLAGSSLTAQFVSGRRSITMPSRPACGEAVSKLVLKDVHLHNLRGVTLSLPLSRFVCITGVSGSGKSSLVMEVLVPAVRDRLRGQVALPATYETLSGMESIRHLVEVDQLPIGQNPRSCPASSLGILDDIRTIFSKTREAKIRGYGRGRFSFNDRSGRCPSCEGLGARLVELQFMPDMYVPCHTCRGKRFNRSTLEVRYRDMSMSDVLALSIEDAEIFFENHERMRAILHCINELGLGYLQLGQWGNTLSGGESQRLKLAAHLSEASFEPTLFVLDEPTTGLHAHDVEGLLKVLSKLVESGHSVVVIEHHLDVIASADWVIDLGPEGGLAGGQIVGEGTPSRIAQLETPTGRELARRLKRPSSRK